MSSVEFVIEEFSEKRKESKCPMLILYRMGSGVRNLLSAKILLSPEFGRAKEDEIFEIGSFVYQLVGHHVV